MPGMEQGIIDSDVVDVPIGYCQWCQKHFMAMTIPAIEYHCYICRQNKLFDRDEYLAFCRTKTKYKPLLYIPQRKVLQPHSEERSRQMNGAKSFFQCPKCDKWKISTDDPAGFIDHMDNCSKN